MWGAYDDGVVTLTDNGLGNVLWTGVQFESQGSVAFEVLAQFDVTENTDFDISLFPNPFKDYTNLSIYSEKGNEMNVEVYNTLGEIVYHEDMTLNTGVNNLKIESKDLLVGMYYINIIIDGKNSLKPLSIIK